MPNAAIEALPCSSWFFLDHTDPTRASDKCQREKRKTINGDDLLWAMSTLGFEDYVEPLKVYLHKYREVGCLSLKVLCIDADNPPG